MAIMNEGTPRRQRVEDLPDIRVRIEPQLLEQLRAIAFAERRTIGAQASVLLSEAIDKHPRK